MGSKLVDTGQSRSRKSKDPLLRNSMLLMFDSLMSAAFGFSFWILAGRIYSENDVGIASALISSMAFIVLVTRFGLDFSLTRYFSTEDKSTLLSTSFVTTTLSAISVGFVFLLITRSVYPDLGLTGSVLDIVLFLSYVCAYSGIATTGAALVANRTAGLFLVQDLFLGLRIPLILVLMPLGFMGIVGSYGTAIVVSLVVALVVLSRSGIRLTLAVNTDFLRSTFKFSMSNYLASILASLPNLVLPLGILAVLGSSDVAYYYIAYSFAAILLMAPSAIATTLFVEGSHGRHLHLVFRDSYMLFISIFLPGGIFFFLGSEWILGFVGASYAIHSISLFRCLVIASFFGGTYSILMSIRRIRTDYRGLIAASSLVFISLVAVAFLLVPSYGLIGIGYAWIMSYAAGCVFLLYRDSTFLRPAVN